MKKLLLAIGVSVLLLLGTQQAMAQSSSLWKIVGTRLMPVIRSWKVTAPGGFSGSSLRVDQLRNCSALETNGAGTVACGTDDTGAGASNFGSGNVLTILQATDNATSTGHLISTFKNIFLASSTGSLKSFFDTQYLRTSTGSLKAYFDLQYLRTSTGSLKVFFDQQYLRTSTGSLKAYFDANYLRTSTGSLKVLFDSLYLRTSTGSLEAYFDTKYDPLGGSSGITQGDGDARYVNVAGDTMTGTLVFTNADAVDGWTILSDDGTTNITGNYPTGEEAMYLDFASEPLLYIQDIDGNYFIHAEQNGTDTDFEIFSADAGNSFLDFDGSETRNIFQFYDTEGQNAVLFDINNGTELATYTFLNENGNELVKFEGDTTASYLYLNQFDGSSLLLASSDENQTVLSFHDPGDIDFITFTGLNGIDTMEMIGNSDFAGTASGYVVRGQNTLASSGTLVWEGTASGSRIRGLGLVDCDDGTNSKLLWDTTGGVFLCGTDQAGAGGTGNFGSGNVLTILQATDNATSTGHLIATFKNIFLASSTGSLKTYFDANYLRTSTGALQTLFDVRYANITGDTFTGTVEIASVGSGRILHAQDLLRSSGALTLDGGFFQDGLADCDNAGEKPVYNFATGKWTCGTDDDVPESGDFAAGVDLEADGSLSADVIADAEMADNDFGDWSCSSGDCTLDADVVAAAEMADADHGDISWSGGVASIDANSVALTTDTTGNYAAGDAEAGAALTGDSATNFFSSGLLALTIGGTNKNLTAVNGGILYTDADSFEVTAAGTSGMLLISQGTAAPVFKREREYERFTLFGPQVNAVTGSGVTFPTAFSGALVDAHLQASGMSSGVTVNVYFNNKRAFSTPISTDNREATSETAATPFVINTTTARFNRKQDMRIDISSVGSATYTSTGIILTLWYDKTSP